MVHDEVINVIWKHFVGNTLLPSSSSHAGPRTRPGTSHSAGHDLLPPRGQGADVWLKQNPVLGFPLSTVGRDVQGKQV